MHEGGWNCLKYLKRGWNRKEGKGYKDFQKGGKVGQGVGALKRGGAGTPLRTMPSCDVIFFEINPFFSHFFVYDQKIKTKKLNILRTKTVFKMK